MAGGKDPFIMGKKNVMAAGSTLETDGGTEIVSVSAAGVPSLKANIQDTLADGSIYVGDATGVTSEVAMSGDATLVNTGAITIGAKKVGAAKLVLTEGAILRGAVGGAAEEVAKGAGNQILAMDGGGGFPGYYTVGGDVNTPNPGQFSISDAFAQVFSVNLTSAQVLNLAATPIELLPAPGAGRGYIFQDASLRLKYGGTNVFTESANNLAIRYTDGSGVIVSEAIETTGFIDQAADTVTNAIAIKDAIVAQAAIENQALVLDNTSGSEIAGNAGDDNELRVTIKYRVIQM